MSTSEQNNGTSYQPSEPKPCANNCGFFGSAATMNLCSKCFRGLRVVEEQAASAKAAVEKSFNPKPSQEGSEETTNDRDQAVAVAVASAVDSAAPEEPLVEAAPSCAAANRCSSCNRKLGLTGFVCKCGSTFCGTHRYPEKHKCAFDFKRAGRVAIAKANPVVKADKIGRF